MFRAAMLVPTAIMLIFSFFSLTAPLDSAKVAGAFTLGVVNNDTGLTFPPLKVSERILAGMAQNLPFRLEFLETAQIAETALDRGRISAALIFPADFSKRVAGGDAIELDILNGNHLTLMETQLGAQLPVMMQSNFSAGVLMLRDALGKGRLPDGVFPVTANVKTLHSAASPALLIAPFVMVFSTWLASFVGAMLLYLACREEHSVAGKALAKTVLPIAATGLSSIVLALTIASTSGDFSTMLAIWLTVWSVTLMLSWFMGGLFAIGGFAALVLAIPLVFYQSAVGGAQAPLGAAPDWLQSVGAIVPFDSIGAIYRAAVHGGEVDAPLMWLALTAVLGLVLIWSGAYYGDRSTRK